MKRLATEGSQDVNKGVCNLTAHPILSGRHVEAKGRKVVARRPTSDPPDMALELSAMRRTNADWSLWSFDRAVRLGAAVQLCVMWIYGTGNGEVER